MGMRMGMVVVWSVLLAACGSGTGGNGGTDLPGTDLTGTDLTGVDHPATDPSPGDLRDVPGVEDEGDSGPADAAADGDPGPREPEFSPFLLRSSREVEPLRGWVIKQGHFHAHNVFSHDACDEMPRTGGETGDRNEECFWEFRESLCTAGLDFLFVTDHLALFADYEYPEVLYFEAGQGDRLIERDGRPVANRIPCPDGRQVLLVPGFDRQHLALGLERHIGDTPEERKALYGARTEEAWARLRTEGSALMALAYSSDWSQDEILALHWDGYEIYNPATNMRQKLAEMAAVLGQMAEDPDQVMHPELGILAAFEEGEKNLQYWSDLLLNQGPAFSFIGPNAHRNLFTFELSDGERLDSYRRIFRWYGNFLMLPESRAQEPDDRDYKAVMAAGRMYSAFLFFGYPVGFDFHAVQNGTIHEMGSALSDASDVELVLEVPRVYGRLPAGAEAPLITGRILKAVPGGWETVASGTGTLSFRPTSDGIYRAEARIIPRHLKAWLGPDPEPYLTERTWVNSNPIYLGTPWRSR